MLSTLPRRRYVSFRFFKMAAAAILNFQNLKFLTVGTVGTVEEGRTATSCQILSKSLEPQMWYGFFRFLRWRPFLKFQIFNSLDSQEGRTASSCQISLKSVKYGYFLDFLRWWPPLSWIFEILNFNSLTDQEDQTA